MVGRELVHLVTTLLLDLILIANLLEMVAVSSYESYISRIDAAGLTNKPKWLGKLDSETCGSGAVNEGPGGEEQFLYTVRRRPWLSRTDRQADREAGHFHHGDRHVGP